MTLLETIIGKTRFKLLDHDISTSGYCDTRSGKSSSSETLRLRLIDIDGEIHDVEITQFHHDYIIDGEKSILDEINKIVVDKRESIINKILK